MDKEYQVLLYYHYVSLEDPETFKDIHKALCQSLNLKGRIIVSHEGINGTVSGLKKDTEAYMAHMHQDERFAQMPFKIDEHDGHAFKKLSVKVRKELVNLSLENDVNPKEKTGKHLSPKEFYEYMNQDDTIVIDARNDYEYELGHFKGAIKPEIRTFRELPQWIKDNKELLGEKKILTYCTGGVRCEKFSGWLLEEGFEDVNQLDGGIATYSKDEATQGKDWLGKMYVFDERISVAINKHEHVVVGKDFFDNTPCERYVNCANPECNRQFLCSEANEHKHLRSCCVACQRVANNRYVIEHNLNKQV